MSIDERVARTVAAALGITVDGIPKDAGYGTIAEWDSLRHLQIMLAIESEFGVQIPANQMLELTSAEKIRQFLNNGGMNT